MNPISTLRKLGQALRGGAQFREIFLGVLIGFILGMLPGANLLSFLLLVAFLVLNVNTGLGVLAFGLGKIFCFVLAPFTFEIGYALIHSMGFGGVVRIFSDVPLLALLDLQVYCLFGGIPVSLLLGSGLAAGCAALILNLRKQLMNPSAEKITQNPVVKALLWLAFGGEAKAGAKGKGAAIFNHARLKAGGVVLAVLVVVQLVMIDRVARVGLEYAISSVTRAEVNVASARLSLLFGSLEVSGLQVTDPQQPTHNQFQAKRISADVSVWNLLRRRFVVDLLECDAAERGVERLRPGWVAEEIEDEPSGESFMKKMSKWAGDSASYYAEIAEFAKDLKRLMDFLSREDEKAKAGTPTEEELYASVDSRGQLLGLSAKKYLNESPTWVIRQLRVSQFRPAPKVPTFIIEGKNLSDRPSLYPEKMELKAIPDEDVAKDLKGLGDTVQEGLKGWFD